MEGRLLDKAPGKRTADSRKGSVLTSTSDGPLTSAFAAQFLNKCDLLQKKLARGVHVVDYIPTFGSRTNDAPSAAKCAYINPPVLVEGLTRKYSATPTDFRQQFRDTLVKHSPLKRNFYSYLTSVVVRTRLLDIWSAALFGRSLAGAS